MIRLYVCARVIAYGALWCLMVPYGALWLMVHCVALWCLMVSCGALEADMIAYDSLL